MAWLICFILGHRLGKTRMTKIPVAKGDVIEIAGQPIARAASDDCSMSIGVLSCRRCGETNMLVGRWKADDPIDQRWLDSRRRR
jgi:hypothetical protein